MIRRKRIRKIEPYLRLIPEGKNVYVGTVNPTPARLKTLGFSDKLKNGETVLPRPVGKTSMYNANGSWLIHRDQPMETAYRTVEWHWTEWHGPYEVEQSDFRDVPYKRYPRTYMDPPSLELELFTDTNGSRVALTNLITDWKNDKEGLVHAVNLILELFGECSFFSESRERLITAPTIRLNWRILPPGKRPYSELRKELTEVIARVRPGNKSFVDHRLDRINGYGPDFTAIGQGGFSGYVVFGFPDKNLYIFESILYGNATYVFEKDWKNLSKKTKAEILEKGLHKERIIHLRSWFSKIKNLLS